jgi:hypothetical protein
MLLLQGLLLGGALGLGMLFVLGALLLLRRFS